MVKRGALENRLDANTYHPERVAMVFQIKASRWEIKPIKLIAIFLKDIVSTNPKGLPYIGLENIESNTGIYVETTEKESFGTAIKFESGKILFPKLRPYLNKVYYSEFEGLCSTEFHVLSSQVVDNKYLSYFLRSKFVVNQTKWLMSGNTLPRLQTADIENLLIPIPPLEIQSQIVEIFNQAYAEKRQKEAEAKELLASIDAYLLEQLGIVLPDKVEEKNVFYVPFSKVQGGRFEPYYYGKDFDDLKDSIRKGTYPTKSIDDISLFVSNGRTPPKSEYADEITDYPIIKAGSYTKDSINLSKTGFTKSKNTGIEVCCNDIFILAAAHQAEYVGKKVYLLEEVPFKPTFYVGELLCIRANPIICNPVYLFFILKLQSFLLLLNREKRGQTSHLYPTDVINIQIPLPPFEIQERIVKEIVIRRNQAQILQTEAKEATEKAKAEVEKMILGE